VLLIFAIRYTNQIYITLQWESKGKDIVEEMVQRFRQWRIRGQVLGNPLQEDEELQSETCCEFQEDDDLDSEDGSVKGNVAKGIPGPPPLDTDGTEFNDQDDDSIIIDA
jgi:hypothetical protein